MFASRRLTASVPRAFSQRALFHSTAPAFVQKGDPIPDLDVLVENSPGNKVNLSKELKGKGVIIGVPAAFSTSSGFRT
jgi:2-Cys peroxiredoxin 5